MFIQMTPKQVPPEKDFPEADSRTARTSADKIPEQTGFARPEDRRFSYNCFFMNN